MIPDWETNFCYLSRLLADRHPALCRQLTGLLDTHGIPVRFLEGIQGHLDPKLLPDPNCREPLRQVPLLP